MNRGPDHPRHDDTASERPAQRDEHPPAQDPEHAGGPYGNPSLDEEALRKSQEEGGRERGRRRPAPGS